MAPIRSACASQGTFQPGSIHRAGTHVQFVLVEEDQNVAVDYTGVEAPPDTFKDDSQALADGSFGRDGVFHAKQLQAKCASKYAPQQPGTPGGTQTSAPAKAYAGADSVVQQGRLVQAAPSVESSQTGADALWYRL